MMHLRVVGCCGGGELVGINERNFTAPDFLRTYARYSSITNYAGTDNEHQSGRSWIVFSGAWHNEKSGWTKKEQESQKKLATENLNKWVKFVKDNQLGEIYLTTDQRPNPNMGSVTTCWAGLWVPNNDAVRYWLSNNNELDKVPTKAKVSEWLNALDSTAAL